MTVHVYDLRGRRVSRRGTLAEVKARAHRRPGYFTTWDDRTGERWERKAGEWRQTAAPAAELDIGPYLDGKMAAAGDKSE